VAQFNEFSNGLRPRRQMEQLEMRNGLFAWNSSLQNSPIQY
jgi:hypothetical protein